METQKQEKKLKEPMIQVKFHTNLDAFKQCRWPEGLCIEPQMGHKVQEVGGSRSLKICDITHCEGACTYSGPSVLYLKIELTNRSWSLGNNFSAGAKI